MNTHPMIIVHDLNYEYPNLRALTGVCVTIPHGSITALVGPNGAGKSTLLRCLAGLNRPLSGQIEVAGINVLQAPRDAHRQIGYLSDFFGLYGTLTVRQCLRFIAQIHHLKHIDEHIDRVVEQLNIANLLNRLTNALSRGQRQRVAIAQAIIHQPKLLLLDEPASGLDPEARHQLGALFHTLRDEGMTLLVSSHILAELDEYATDVLIIDAGKVVEYYPIENVQNNSSRYEIELSHIYPDLKTYLEAQNGVTWISGDGIKTQIDIQGDATTRKHLLSGLCRHEIPVCGLSRIKISMQDTYLHKVRTARQQETQK